MADDIAPEKLCGHCKRSLPRTEFAPRKPNGSRFRDGLHYWCRHCVREQARLYYARNSYAPREYHFKKKYGITIAERDALIAQQSNRCAICSTEQGDVRWNTLSVDHSHAEGVVRGMLCSHCNRGLGHFRDNPELLLAAAAYLLQHTDVLPEGGTPLS